MSYPMITTAAILLGIASTSLVSANLDQSIDIRPDEIGAEPGSILPQKNGFDFPHVDNELIVRFRPEVSLEERQALFGLVTGQTKYAYKSVSDLYCIKLEGSARDAFEMIKDRSDILMYAEPAYLMETFVDANDPDYNSMYGLAAINAPEAWDTTTGTSTTRIAIIDSGMDMDHPDLVDNLFRNPAEGTGANGIDEDGNGLTDDISGWDFYDNDNNPDDQNGHGSHTGGTVGAAGNNGIGITGINWECDLIALRVGNQSLSSSAIYASVEYACDMGARVSNNSYGGGGYAQAFFDIIEAAGSNCGHVFCAAAGNGGYEGASYPAAYNLSNIISVAAVDSNENLASFSQYGVGSVDIGAPGVDILSTVPGGYSEYSGTSMATPHVAGVAGLVSSMLGEVPASDVIDAILGSARPTSSMSGVVATGGVLDAAAAMENLFRAPTATLLTSVPSNVLSGESLQVDFTIDPRDDTISNLGVFYRPGSGPWVPVGSSPISGVANGYRAFLAPAECDQSPQFYISYTGVQSGSSTLPVGGTSAPYGFVVGEEQLVAQSDFNTSAGWSASTTATAGGWERGVPSSDSISVNDCSAPGSDSDGSGSCWVTGNGESTFGCEFDVDSGQTQLTSAIYAASGDDQISVDWWYDNTSSNNTEFDDQFVVDVSGNSGGSWTTVASISNGDSAQSGWTTLQFTVSDYVTVGSGFQIRFTASDNDPGSVVEAGIDNFKIGSFVCDDGPACDIVGDLNCDQVVNGQDLAVVLSSWGCTGTDCPGDVTGDFTVNGQDVAIILANWSI
jgi:subtilisin family serine protease